MKIQRESLYRCVFESSESRRVAHVRAWDADEAALLFKTELASDGVDERGTIEVFPYGDEAAHPAAYPA